MMGGEASGQSSLTVPCMHGDPHLGHPQLNGNEEVPVAAQVREFLSESQSKQKPRHPTSRNYLPHIFPLEIRSRNIGHFYVKAQD